MESDPPPRQFKLKPKEFERVNAPPGTQAPSDDHDVFALRRQVRAREQAAGADDLAPRPPRRSKRTRDFWLCAAAAGVAPPVIGRWAVGPLGLIAGLGVGTVLVVAAWWIFYHVMDEY